MQHYPQRNSDVGTAPILVESIISHNTGYGNFDQRRKPWRLRSDCYAGRNSELQAAGFPDFASGLTMTLHPNWRMP
jgi:hypothetical protein